MSKKPFHVLRFKKALQSSVTGGAEPQPADPCRPKEDKSTHACTRMQTPTFCSGPTNATDPTHIQGPTHSAGSTPSTGPTHTAGSTHISGPINALDSSVCLTKECLPNYLQPDSECRRYDGLVDESTPIQQYLGPFPFSPTVWDKRRSEFIRKHAAIYGQQASKRKSEQLSRHEASVNEAAFQLCLRDPTLLVRREELFLISRRAVKKGGYAFTHGYSRAKAVSSSKPLAGTVLCQAGRTRRVERLAELDAAITQNEALHAGKLKLMEQAQERADYVHACRVQSEIDALGCACQKLQTEQSLLLKKERRSQRYCQTKGRDCTAPPSRPSTPLTTSPSTPLTASPSTLLTTSPSTPLTASLALPCTPYNPLPTPAPVNCSLAVDSDKLLIPMYPTRPPSGLPRTETMHPTWLLSGLPRVDPTPELRSAATVLAPLLQTPSYTFTAPTPTLHPTPPLPCTHTRQPPSIPSHPFYSTPTPTLHPHGNI